MPCRIHDSGWEISMTRKRDIFAELLEGFEELATMRPGNGEPLSEKKSARSDSERQGRDRPLRKR
jgi:hypothetical protein